MSCSLIDALKQIKDPRAARGCRYPLWLLLVLVILGTLSGCQGYQALEDFCQRHYQAVGERLGVVMKRPPSDSTFRRLFHLLDFQQLSEWFWQWMEQTEPLSGGDWLSVDGKSIGSTVTNAHQGHQNFVNVVSVYSQRRGIVVAQRAFENGKGSEIQAVESLLAELQMSGSIFTMDALHAQKKHCN
jgi:hypothetical protein